MLTFHLQSPIPRLILLENNCLYCLISRQGTQAPQPNSTFTTHMQLGKEHIFIYFLVDPLQSATPPPSSRSQLFPALQEKGPLKDQHLRTGHALAMHALSTPQPDASINKTEGSDFIHPLTTYLLLIGYFLQAPLILN